MANLFDYIYWRGDLPFERDPLNKLDALCLAQLTYIILDGLVEDDFKESQTLQQVAKSYRRLPDFKERSDLGFLINDRTTDLLFECAQSERFKNVKLCGYRNIFSEKNVEQFAAVTFIIEEKKHKQIVVSYKGTDDTIIGFQEDFEIGYKTEIPSQRDGLAYFNEVAEAFPKGDYILIGHSKGGNIALNTAVKCLKKQRKKISAIYNFDGPGFPLEFYKSEEYAEIEPVIYSFYPQLSVVGMLFHHPKNYEIVESSNFAIMQHDALSWQLLGKNFVNKTDFTDECKIFAQSFNNWIDQVTLEERHQFVDSLFYLIKSSGFKTNSEIEKNPLQASARILNAYTKMEKNKKEEFKDIFGLLIDTVKSELPVFKLSSK